MGTFTPYFVGFLESPSDLGDTTEELKARDKEGATAEAERLWVPKLKAGQRVELHIGRPSWQPDRRCIVTWELDAEGKIVRNDNPR
jgi:hypothetical protein